MAYYIPQLHKCNKCGYEQETNSPESFKACPKCLDEFLKKNVGELILVKQVKKND